MDLAWHSVAPSVIMTWFWPSLFWGLNEYYHNDVLDFVWKWGVKLYFLPILSSFVALSDGAYYDDPYHIELYYITMGIHAFGALAYALFRSELLYI